MEAFLAVLCVFGPLLIASGILNRVPGCEKIHDGLVSAFALIRNALWALVHRSPRPRRPYLSADTVEELEIECYIGPYAEPFRAESLRAREAAKRKRDSVRVIEPCEREDETAHIFAMNGRCILCGTFPPRTPEYAPVKLDGDTMADCLGDPNQDHHRWRTFRDLEGFHTKCLRCGTFPERPITRLPNPGRQERR